MIDSLDIITTPEGAKNLLKKYQQACQLSRDFEITEIKRQLVLAPETFALLYEIDDHGKKRQIRVNASQTESRQNAYTYMKKIETIFDENFSIPKAYFYDENFNAVAYENVQGQLLIDLIKTGKDLSQEISLCGKWLNKLHANFQGTFVHGDFQPTNIVINEGSITVFDFNDTKEGDPAIDIASFFAQLRVMLLRFGPQSDFDSLKKIFLENYGLEFNLSLEKSLEKKKYLVIYETLKNALDEEEKEVLPMIKAFYDEIN